MIHMNTLTETNLDELFALSCPFLKEKDSKNLAGVSRPIFVYKSTYGRVIAFVIRISAPLELV